MLIVLLLLQSLPSDEITSRDPIVWWIIGVLLAVVVTLSGVIVRLTTAHKKDLDALREEHAKEVRECRGEINELNEWVRGNFPEWMATLASLISVVEGVTNGQSKLGEDVRSLITGALADIKTHMAVALNFPTFREKK